MSEEKKEGVCRIRIKTYDAEFEVEGNEYFVRESADKLIKLLTPMFQKLVRPSFVEFANEKVKPLKKGIDQLSSEQKILLIAYYVYAVEGKRDFTYDDVEKYSQEARLSGLANPRQYMSELIRKGFVKEGEVSEGKKKTFSLLRSGILYVESGFKEELSPEEPNGRRVENERVTETTESEETEESSFTEVGK